MKIALKVIMTCMLVVAVAYLGTCAYANFFAGDGSTDLPDVDDAGYAIQIMSTGRILFSNHIIEEDNLVKCKGYWEYDGEEYKYQNANLTLNEEYFGEIKVAKRR